MKKILATVLLLLYLCTLSAFAEPNASPTPSPVAQTPAAEPYSGSATVSILYTSDIHGNIQRNEEKGTLGYSGIAAIQRSLPDSILIDGGDYLTSNLFVAQDTVDNVLNLMNSVGYHLAAVGEADLLNGSQVMKEVQEKAAFHMLSSNVTTGSDRTPLLGSTKIINVKGINLGFFSILNPELRLTTGLEELTDIYLEDASKTAQNCVNSLKEQGADVIIALTHIGTQDSTTVDQLAAFVSGIDFIFDGHDHQANNGRFIGETLILNPGANGEHLMQLDLKFGANKSLRSFSTTQWSYPALEKLPMDEAIVYLENSIIEAQTEFLDEAVAISKVELPYPEDIGYRSVPLGNFIADSYLKKTTATIAMVDAGSIAAGVPGGSVTKAHILSILPDSRVLQEKKVTPKALKTALESAVSTLKLKDDGTIDPDSATDSFPQIAGFRVDVNLKNEPGERVMKIKLDNGVTLNLTDDRTTITLVSNSRLLSGENAYDVFDSYPVEAEYVSEGQALLDYINATEEYPDYTEARIRMTDQQKSYTGLIVTILLSIVLVVMLMVVIIKMMTRVS